MGPLLFAIFVVCTPDLLYCNDTTTMTAMFRYHYENSRRSTDLCKAYVVEMLAIPREDNQILMGKCVWRIVTQ